MEKNHLSSCAGVKYEFSEAFFKGLINNLENGNKHFLCVDSSFVEYYTFPHTREKPEWLFFFRKDILSSDLKYKSDVTVKRYPPFYSRNTIEVIYQKNVVLMTGKDIL